jgi:hypothetical protein
MANEILLGWRSPSRHAERRFDGVASGKETRRTRAGLRDRLDVLPPAARAELLHVPMLPDFDRADAIGCCWGNPNPHLRRAPDRSCDPGEPYRVTLREP